MSVRTQRYSKIMELSGLTVPKKIKDLKRSEPVDSESEFSYEELFFSITDLQSHITFANKTFIRISKYKEEEIIGCLHKIIRHPDMPGAVFEIFWDFLKAGKPVAAYVKNMAKDGSYYWVMALAVPSKGGYQSVRLKPGSKLFDKIKELYKDILENEQQLEASTDRKKAIKASVAYLNKKLKDQGYSDYSDFMWKALQTEIQNREEQLPPFSDRLKKYKNGHIDGDMIELAEVVNDLFISLKKLEHIETGLIEHSDKIIHLSGSILLLSLNAQVGSAKMKSSDSSLSVIAEKMGEQATYGENVLNDLKDLIVALRGLSAEISFHIMYTKLQVEMTIDFLNELTNEKSGQTETGITSDEAVDILKSAYIPQIKSIRHNLKTIPQNLQGIFKRIEQVERFIMTLRFIHITGKVEISRIHDDKSSFATTFHELIGEIQSAESYLKSLTTIKLDNKGLSGEFSQFFDRMTRVVK